MAFPCFKHCNNICFLLLSPSSSLKASLTSFLWDKETLIPHIIPCIVAALIFRKALYFAGITHGRYETTWNKIEEAKLLCLFRQLLRWTLQFKPGAPLAYIPKPASLLKLVGGFSLTSGVGSKAPIPVPHYICGPSNKRTVLG